MSGGTGYGNIATASSVAQSPAQNIRSYLASQGYASSYWNFRPDTPDDVVCVYDYDGEPDSLAMGNKNVTLQHPRIQIVVRDSNPTEAYETAYAIYQLLSGTINLTINSNTYHLIQALNLPRPSQDPLRRTIYFLNFAIDRKPV